MLHNILRISLFLVVSFVAASCDLAKNHLKPDRSSNMEIQDYRDSLAPRLPVTEDTASDAQSIPSLMPYIASGSEAMKSMPLVTIKANSSVSLKDILFELARQADYDIELDPRIRGAIIFTARERPFDQVIERISDLAGLRYRFEDDILRVELDTPYVDIYKINYLSYVRTNSGSISNDISVVSGEGTDTGSKYQSSIKSESDFWGEIDSNLAQILAAGSTGALLTSYDPRIVATEQNPDVVAVGPVDDGSGNLQVQPPEAVLHVESLPVDDGSDGGSFADDENDATFSINKQAGLVNVFATQKTHKDVAKYLRLLERSVTAQVLIEAKILEVTLNDQYATGIDWRAMDLLSGEGAINYLTATGAGLLDTLGPGTAAIPGGAPLAATSSIVVGYAGNDVQAIVKAVSTFGTVKALASPRLTVLNNQSAVLNVATNRIFFELDVESTTDGGGGASTNIDSTIRNVPEGVLVNVQPSIDLEKGTISLAMRPTITRIVGTKPDPSVLFAAAIANLAVGIEADIPELNVQEIDTVMQVRSGQPVIMGGLLQDRANVNENGIPGLAEIPLFGALFRQHNDQVQKTELVIFLKATILDAPGDSIHDTDRDLYRQFSGDRRPFKL